MTLPEFSVLLLAWDDNDPNVAVLGGSALPPTLPLVYQLAAQQPVLAVYPHLPTDDAPTSPLAETLPEPEAQEAEEESERDTPDSSAPQLSAPATPGVRLLPGPPAPKTGVAPPVSRLVGLRQMTVVSTTQLRKVLPVPAATAASPQASPRSQWPTGENAPQLAQWQVPAAPYLGATVTPPFPPAPPHPTEPNVAEPATGFATTTQQAFPLEKALIPTVQIRLKGPVKDGDLRFDPDPELPYVRRPETFDEPVAELGPGEASALSAPEDDLVPDAPAPIARPVATPAPVAETTPPPPAAPPSAPVLLKPAPDGLNFRAIQYARQAAQLVRERSDFSVIYAPNWPAWLAALEIRNSTGLPLVLYAASLAADTASPAERGWQLEMERMTMRRAKLILVPDQAVQRRVEALYGATTGEVRIVPAHDEAAVQQILREVAVG